VDGIEQAHDGVNDVGGSYLSGHPQYMSVREEASVQKTYLTHMIKIFQFCFCIFCLNTCANLNTPLPLLVVHSGKTTIGPFDVDLTSSNDLTCPVCEDVGIFPTYVIICRRDTEENPVIDIRLARDCFDEICAEPVPVLRPGVCWISELSDVETDGSGSLESA
jgi:hypothetical protein